MRVLGKWAVLIVALVTAGLCLTLDEFSLRANAGVPNDSDHVPVHAVMFEFDYDAEGNIHHAQAMEDGGFPSKQECEKAMPSVMAMAVARLAAEGLMPKLLCASIEKHVVTATVPETQT